MEGLQEKDTVALGDVAVRESQAHPESSRRTHPNAL